VLDGAEVLPILLRLYLHSNGHYYLAELFLVGLLNTNQELSVFLPALYGHLAHSPTIFTANLYALGYLLPGLHLKTFFLLFAGEDWPFLALSYLALHLPSLLVLCTGLGHRKLFFSPVWGKMSGSVQSASNGLVLVAVWTMLSEESCQWNIVFFTSLVIFTVTKLYKFNEVISALLGVFLVASRAAVLHFNNKKSLSDFLCRK
jgi:chromate transport protein ChrA